MQVVLFGITALKLAAQEERTSVEAVAAEAPEEQVALAS